MNSSGDDMMMSSSIYKPQSIACEVGAFTSMIRCISMIDFKSL